MSTMIFGTMTPKLAMISTKDSPSRMQCPATLESQDLAIGTHWKADENRTVIHHMEYKIARVVHPIFMKRVGNMRQYRAKMLSLVVDMHEAYMNSPANRI